MNRNGFSLAEVVVAAVVFSFSVAGVFSAVASFRVPVEDSSKRLRAAQLAKKVMEDLRNKIIQNAAHPDLDTANPHHGSESSPFIDPEFPGYEYWYEARRMPGRETIKVDVTVRTPSSS